MKSDAVLKHPQGGRIRREAALWLSTLMPVDPTTDAGTRVSSKIVDGAKVRVVEVRRAPKGD